MATGHEGSPSAEMCLATGGVKWMDCDSRVLARARVGKKEGRGLCVVLFCEFEVTTIIVETQRMCLVASQDLTLCKAAFWYWL